MNTHWYSSIDDLGAERIAPLEGSPVDFSYGLLRAMELSLWGDVRVRYLSIEEGRTVLGFLPVYYGTNIEFMAIMPTLMKRGYAALVEHMGLGQAYRVAVAGSLISDRGFIPLLPGCDRDAVLDRIVNGIDELAAEQKLHLGFIKDVHQDFPGIDRFRRRTDFVPCYSLPTVRVDTNFASKEDYIASLSPNGRSHARRTLKKVLQRYTIRYESDYADLIPRIYPLFRATYLKATYKLEEPPPAFFYECARAQPPGSEVILCEREGRIAGAYLIYFHGGQQLNKRVGIDYSDEESALVYNAINYHSILRGVERGIPLSYMGQSTYTPKLRMGGKLEDQFLFIKGYQLSVRLSLPIQQRWMNRYRAANIERVARYGE